MGVGGRQIEIIEVGRRQRERVGVTGQQLEMMEEGVRPLEIMEVGRRQWERVVLGDVLVEVGGGGQ